MSKNSNGRHWYGIGSGRAGWDQARLERLVTHWLKERRERAVKIDWQFTTSDARIKLKRFYPEMTG